MASAALNTLANCVRRSRWLRSGLQYNQTRSARGAGGGKLPEAQRFIDKCRILVVGGNGGNGAVSFHKDNWKEFGGPDGANGGNGASVYLEAVENLADLSRDRYTYKGSVGGTGGGRRMTGRNGKDIVIPVPVGTVVRVLENPKEGIADVPPEPGHIVVQKRPREPELTKISTLFSHRSPGTSGPKVRRTDIRARLRNQHRKRMRQEAGVVDEDEDEEEEEEDEEWEDDEEESEQGMSDQEQHDKRLGKGHGPWLASEESFEEYIARISGEQIEKSTEEEEDEEPVYRTLKDLDVPGERILVAAGGLGGRGNVSFSSRKDRASTDAELGAPGQKFRLELELKVLADIGLIGFPNAGKSSLLAALSAAKPKIASYPFTTLRPHLGVIEIEENYDTYTMADIPGLIEGAHEDIGLGHTFLRHIERAKVLVYILDTAGVDGREAWNDLFILKSELDKYIPGLSSRASLIVANKMDLEQSEDGLLELKLKLEELEATEGPSDLTQAPLIEISCEGRKGLEEVKQAMYKLVVQKRGEKLDKQTGQPLPKDWQ